MINEISQYVQQAAGAVLIRKDAGMASLLSSYGAFEIYRCLAISCCQRSVAW